MRTPIEYDRIVTPGESWEIIKVHAMRSGLYPCECALIKKSGKRGKSRRFFHVSVETGDVVF